MQTLKNYMTGGAALVVIGLVSSAITTDRASAQRGQQPTQVEIVAPLPAGDFSAIAARPEEFTINHAVRLYADAPFAISVNLTRNSSQGLALLQLTFSGYLADM